MEQISRQKTKKRHKIQNGGITPNISRVALECSHTLQEEQVTMFKALPKHNRADDFGDAEMDKTTRVEGGAILILQAFQELYHFLLDLLC